MACAVGKVNSQMATRKGQILQIIHFPIRKAKLDT